MSEAERILHKTAAGMSFYDRLATDGTLRRELLDVLQEMEGVALEDVVERPRKRFTVEQLDTDMREVPVTQF